MGDRGPENGKHCKAGAYPLEQKIGLYRKRKETRKKETKTEQTICFASKETPGLISGNAVLVAQAEGAWYGGLRQSLVI